MGLGAGEPRDARLVEVASLTVAEASLTGESEAVLKDIAPLTEPAGLGDRVNMVFNGTAVTRGRGRAVVTATGRFRIYLNASVSSTTSVAWFVID